MGLLSILGLGRRKDDQKPQVAQRPSREPDDLSKYLSREEFDKLRGQMIRLSYDDGTVLTGKLIPNMFPEIDGYDFVFTREGDYESICGIHPREKRDVAEIPMDWEHGVIGTFGMEYCHLKRNEDGSYSTAHAACGWTSVVEPAQIAELEQREFSFAT